MGMRLNRREFLKALGTATGGAFALMKWFQQVEGVFLPAGGDNISAKASVLSGNLGTLPIAPTDSSEAQSGVAGTIADIVTGLPVGGAQVTIAGFGTAVSDAAGHYVLAIRSGTYEIQVQAAGYISMSRVDQQVPASSLLAADFMLIPMNPSEADNQAIYERSVGATAGSSPGSASILGPGELSIGPTLAVPTTISVQIQNPDGSLSVVLMGLDDYVKGVVPAEMPASWPMEALKAQAVTARTYAVAYTQSGRAICTTSLCQVYTSNRYTSTNSAVDATSGQVVTYNGSIVSTSYFASCGGLGTVSAQSVGWGNAPWEIGTACGGPHPALAGHRVGMCQYGARNRANEGRDYLYILGYYYANIVVFGTVPPPAAIAPANGQFFLTGTSVTLSWTAVSNGAYYGEAQRVGGGWSSQFGSLQSPQASTTWALGALPPGLYQWRVAVVVNSTISSVFSQYYYFIIADKVYKTYFPRMYKNGAAQ